uniref:Uncharacterized protein n=1 Tax=Ixodes ricinus TaxID=34613 RepID=A0A6B0VAB1_IXORI
MGRQVQPGHLGGVGLALLLAEAEHDDGSVVAFHDHLDDLVAVGLSFESALAPFHGRVALGRVAGVLEDRHGLVELLLLEVSAFVHDEVKSAASRGEDVVLERDRPVFRVHDVTGLLVQVADPLSELLGVGNGGREEHITHIVRQQDDRLFPHHASLFVPHVMNLVEDDPPDLPHDLGALVQHAPQDLCCHDEAAGAGVDGDVARHEANVLEVVRKLPKLLVAESLDWSGVNDPLLFSKAQRDGILSHDGLSGRGVGGHQHALVVLQAEDGLLLERIEDERVLARRRAVRAALEGDILHPLGHCDLVYACFDCLDLVHVHVRQVVFGVYVVPYVGNLLLLD